MTESAYGAERIAQYLIGMVAQEMKVPQEEVDPDESFLEAGLDSLQVANLGVVVDEKFGVEVPVTALFDYPTINGLASYISEQIAEQG